VRAKRRGTIAGSVRSELFAPVPRRDEGRRRRFGERRRRRFGRWRRDVFGDGRRRRFDWREGGRGSLCVMAGRGSTGMTVEASRGTAMLRLRPDHGVRRRSVRDDVDLRSRTRLPLVPIRLLSPRFLSRRLRLPLRHHPYRPRPRQPDVGAERRRLRRAQQSRQQAQGEQADGDDRRHPRHPAPPDPHARHPSPRDGPSRFLPRRNDAFAVPRAIYGKVRTHLPGPAQERAARAFSMSASWSSTQSPGLRPKTISRRPAAHSAFCSGSMVRAR
jgi:hypothetical protein